MARPATPMVGRCMARRHGFALPRARGPAWTRLPIAPLRHDLALAGAGDDGPHVTVRRRDTTVSAREREEMLAGKLYNPADPELSAMRKRAGDLCTRFNALPRGDHAGRAAVLDELLPPMHPIRFQDATCGVRLTGVLRLRVWQADRDRVELLVRRQCDGGRRRDDRRGCVIGAGSARPRHQILVRI